MFSSDLWGDCNKLTQSLKRIRRLNVKTVPITIKADDRIIYTDSMVLINRVRRLMEIREAMSVQRALQLQAIPVDVRRNDFGIPILK